MARGATQLGRTETDATEEVLHISVGGEGVNSIRSEPGYLWIASSMPHEFHISFTYDIGKLEP